MANAGVMTKPKTTDPLFSGVDLPPVPVFNGQPEVITTRTLVIYGTGRLGGGGRARGAPATGPDPTASAVRARQEDGEAGRRGADPVTHDRGANDVHAPGEAIHRVRHRAGRAHESRGAETALTGEGLETRGSARTA